MLLKYAICIVVALFFCLPFSFGQSKDSTGNLLKVPDRFYQQTQDRMQTMDQQISGQSVKYLNRLSRLENKLLRNMYKRDSSVASHLPAGNYQQWIDHLHDSVSRSSGINSTYAPGLDTLQTTLRFLQQQGFSSGTSAVNSPLGQATAGVQQLQADLDRSGMINQYIALRKQVISQYLAHYSNLPPGVAQTFDQYKSTAYYYRQQLEAFKHSLNDPQKLQEQVIQQLSKLPAYQQFLSQHSLLAMMFQLPAGYSDNPALQGLQTHDQVQQIIQQQVSAGGSGAQAAIDQQMSLAQNQLSNMQNNLAKYGAAGQDLDMPNFTPNQQKTKTFLKRLTYGTSLQLAKSSGYFPATGNLGLSVGYKINNNNSIGIGASYNIGLGRDWGHMQFSSQGLGLRSFLDLKIKKSYYLTGGYELNYMSVFNSIVQLKDQSLWQPSALIGVEKKYKVSAKVQGNIQLLFDALYKQELPAGQMFKFRVGYGF